MFSPLGGASVAAESNAKKIENSDRYAENLNGPLVHVTVKLSNKIILSGRWRF
jgi:hypothetical protein